MRTVWFLKMGRFLRRPEVARNGEASKGGGFGTEARRPCWGA